MLKGKHVYLKPVDRNEIEPLLELETRNKDFFNQFAPTRDDDFCTLEGQAKRLERMEENRENDLGYSFGIYLNDSDILIGQIGLFKLERGPGQKAMVGYSLDKEHNGKGYMTEALKLIVRFAFNQIKLHRIEAQVMPRNIGSVRILEKNGFHKEGIAKKNVMINGKWEDHQMLAILNDHYEQVIKNET
ncbi:GNAT family N-acetyltransferase [Fictibacillus phosphorivorans]|uniref:GNAT family N-acetyltransferase n=1 Tax=Fictibacillus phosphorivorans TaxID=1221500 RepID=UPI0020406A7D|nr:GNAT family protein [Fictibacillus phosphorivorans]MCM3718161.1 GNAT family N-acetyltransferase [Fictibacillus phosphorivorans]MCM3775788.1 GNAT family N-acetyltransferase [Fictibacillus phosphorivorans]